MAERRHRYFTPEEANVLIPELSVRLSRCGDLLRRHQDLVERADEDVARRAELLFQAEAVRAEAEGIVQDIATQGVEIKGVEPALLDFPALRYGQEVFLCWRSGESRVEAWHPMTTGFAGRQPLEPGDSGPWEWCN
jgi:hypothetical protein